MYVASGYRWVILTVLGLSLAMQAMVMIALTPVSNVVASAYQMNSVFLVNFCAITFSFCQIPLTFVAIYCFKHFRVSVSLRTASLVQFGGSMVRLLSIPLNSFYPVVLGSMLMACSAPFFVNS